jgi:hypothetical protein
MAASQHETLRLVLNGDNRKVPMDVKQKQCAVIEFLLLEEHPSDEMAMRLQNMYGQDAYCLASVF